MLSVRGCGLAQPGVLLCPPGTDLSDAVLSGCALVDDVLTGVDLTGANLSEANLRDISLDGADLTDANLTRADLTFANLADSVLAGANLGRANLDASTLTGVDWDDTICPDGTNSDQESPPTCCGHLNGKVPVAGC